MNQLFNQHRELRTIRIPVIEFESGIPIPPKQPNIGKGKFSDIFGVLKVGESFVLHTAQERSAALMSARRMNVKVTTRKLKEGGFRVWRI